MQLLLQPLDFFECPRIGDSHCCLIGKQSESTSTLDNLSAAPNRQDTKGFTSKNQWLTREARNGNPRRLPVCEPLRILAGVGQAQPFSIGSNLADLALVPGDEPRTIIVICSEPRFVSSALRVASLATNRSEGGSSGPPG